MCVCLEFVWILKYNVVCAAYACEVYFSRLIFICDFSNISIKPYIVSYVLWFSLRLFVRLPMRVFLNKIFVVHSYFIIYIGIFNVYANYRMLKKYKHKTLSMIEKKVFIKKKGKKLTHLAKRYNLWCSSKQRENTEVRQHYSV